jgi:hypothetical protein
MRSPASNHVGRQPRRFWSGGTVALTDGRVLRGSLQERGGLPSAKRSTVTSEGGTMMKLWSELPAARLKEQAADVATIAWILFWAPIAWRLFELLAAFGAGGRALRSGGQSMVQSGRDLGDALADLPFVGSELRDTARDAFAAIGGPLAGFGTGVEQFIVVVAALIALMLALVTIGPWLSRYLPWRWRRVRRMRAAHRVIRTVPSAGDPAMEQALAMRAVSRLDYSTLLEYTPDPLGDWASGRHDRLARAELASVGLRPPAVITTPNRGTLTG